MRTVEEEELESPLEKLRRRQLSEAVVVNKPGGLVQHRHKLEEAEIEQL